MLGEAQIRDAIRNRLEAASESCNSTHLTHTGGVIRGLIWALTGEDPGTRLLHDVSRTLELAGIPYKLKDDGEIEWIVERTECTHGIGPGTFLPPDVSAGLTRMVEMANDEFLGWLPADSHERKILEAASEWIAERTNEQ